MFFVWLLVWNWSKLCLCCCSTAVRERLRNSGFPWLVLVRRTRSLGELYRYEGYQVIAMRKFRELSQSIKSVSLNPFLMKCCLKSEKWPIYCINPTRWSTLLFRCRILRRIVETLPKLCTVCGRRWLEFPYWGSAGRRNWKWWRRWPMYCGHWRFW